MMFLLNMQKNRLKPIILSKKNSFSFISNILNKTKSFGSILWPCA